MKCDPTNVSRVEFYQALSLVWLFISFAFMVRLSGSRSWDTGLYFLVSFTLTVVYTISWVKLHRRRSREPAAA